MGCILTASPELRKTSLWRFTALDPHWLAANCCLSTLIASWSLVLRRTGSPFTSRPHAGIRQESEFSNGTVRMQPFVFIILLIEMPCYWLHTYPSLVDLEYRLKKMIDVRCYSWNKWIFCFSNTQSETHTHTMQDGPLLVFPAHTDGGMKSGMSNSTSLILLVIIHYNH